MISIDILEDLLSGKISEKEISNIGSLSDLGISDIWKIRCAVCARVCFVLEDMSISFEGESREKNLKFAMRYLEQKPLKCSGCGSHVCTSCAAKAAKKAPIHKIIRNVFGQSFPAACPFCIMSEIDFAGGTYMSTS